MAFALETRSHPAFVATSRRPSVPGGTSHAMDEKANVTDAKSLQGVLGELQERMPEGRFAFGRGKVGQHDHAANEGVRFPGTSISIRTGQWMPPRTIHGGDGSGQRPES